MFVCTNNMFFIISIKFAYVDYVQVKVMKSTDRSDQKLEVSNYLAGFASGSRANQIDGAPPASNDTGAVTCIEDISAEAVRVLGQLVDDFAVDRKIYKRAYTVEINFNIKLLVNYARSNYFYVQEFLYLVEMIKTIHEIEYCFYNF